MSRHTSIPVALALVILARAVSAQTPTSAAADSAARLHPRAVYARRITGAAPTIDGRLDDAAWRDVPVAADFVSSRPHPGGVPSLRTEARVLFDDEALYVAVRAYDPRPDSILAPYPRRDDEITSDWLFVELDTRHDHRSGYSFGLNPRGVQVDGTWSDDGNYDPAWNGVWEGAARVDAEGWTAEFRIPFAQLALPAGGDPAATFGMNVYRFAPHRGEVSNWSPRLPSFAGVVSHFNELRGIALPHAEHRVQLVPYASVRAAHAPPSAGNVASAAAPRGGAVLEGADLRVRLTPAFALSAAVRPDFGQVEADPAIVNLTAFEPFFPEQRPFFVDDADRFVFNPTTSAVPGQGGSSGLGVAFTTRDVGLANDVPFYSRRIGRPPHADAVGGADVLDFPPVVDIIGAAKVAGRTSSGWSSGLLGAVTDRAVARVRLPEAPGAIDVVVEPRTDYAVARVSRDLAGGHGALGGIVTLTRRSGLATIASVPGHVALDDALPQSALLAGLDGRRHFGGSAGNPEYELSGMVAASRVTGDPLAIRALEGDNVHDLLRPDAVHLERFRNDSTRQSLVGTTAQLRLAKPGGHWLWSVTGHVISPGFASNDVGFGRSTDWLLAVGTLTYQHYEAGRILRRWSVGFDQVGAGWSTGGERRGAAATLRAALELHSEWGGSLALKQELPSLSTDALRGGPALLLPARSTWIATLHSNTRRATQATWQVTHGDETASGWSTTALTASLDARLADRLRVALQPSVARTRDPWHFVGTSAGVTPCGGSGACYVVGRLTQTTASLTMRTDLAFTSRATIQLYAQPLVGTAAYDRFATVVSPRARDVDARIRPLDAGLPSGVVDPSFGTHRVLGTIVWRWEYRPGSTLFLVATQTRAGADADARWRPADALRTLTRDPTTSVVQVKWSYWWQP